MAREANFDGLVGPTHNYGGLSDGNLASARLVCSPSMERCSVVRRLAGVK